MVLLLTACALTGVDQVALVSLDASARGAGWWIETETREVDGALPAAVLWSDSVTLMGDLEALELPVRAGELLFVEGPRALLDGASTGDLDPDALWVSGAEDAVLELADALDVEAFQESPDWWLLEGPDALLEAALLDWEPEGLVQVEPAWWSQTDMTNGSRAPGSQLTARVVLAADAAAPGLTFQREALDPEAALRERIERGPQGLEVLWAGMWERSGSCLLLKTDGTYGGCRETVDSGHWIVVDGEVLLSAGVGHDRIFTPEGLDLRDAAGFVWNGAI